MAHLTVQISLLESFCKFDGALGSKQYMDSKIRPDDGSAEDII